MRRPAPPFSPLSEFGDGMRASARHHGAFSSRNRVGCDIRSRPLSGRRPQASLDEVFVRINSETYNLWRAVDHEGEVLEVFATRDLFKRNRSTTLAEWRQLAA